jgi:hypothetical protein
MKTSTRIIVIFFIIIFLIPVFMMMGFVSLVKKGEYTQEKSEASFQNGNFRQGTFKPFKVVKVKGSERFDMRCSFKTSSGSALRYNYTSPINRNMVDVFNSGDTLVIQVNEKLADEIRAEDEIAFRDLYFSVTVELPGVANLIVDHATVHSFGTAGPGFENLSAEVVNNGNLVLRDSHLNTVNFKGNGGRLTVFKGMQVDQLNVETAGASGIELAPGSVVNNIQGTISDSTTLEANLNYIKKLGALGIK